MTEPTRGGRRRRGGGPSLKIIKWRDIPAQVNGTSGDQKVQVELPHRFQAAIDRAAMIADLKDANSYVAEMGQEVRPLDGDDVEAAVAALVTEIETEFTMERLNEFVRAGGFSPENPDANTPENPDANTPENPDVNTPENPDVNTPENPDVNTVNGDQA